MTDEKLIYAPAHTTHWKNLFPNKMLLLGSQNLNPGEELIAVIKSVDIQDITAQNGEVEQVPVLLFDNAPPMVLNITNVKTIAALYGDRYEHWPGKAIQIYATQVRAFGETVDALRIREAIPETGEDVSAYEATLRACTTMTDLAQAFTAIPKHLKPRLVAVKDECKAALNAE